MIRSRNTITLTTNKFKRLFELVFPLTGGIGLAYPGSDMVIQSVFESVGDYLQIFFPLFMDWREKTLLISATFIS